MFKLRALILCAIAIHSHNCRIVKRDSSYERLTYDSTPSYSSEDSIVKRYVTTSNLGNTGPSYSESSSSSESSSRNNDASAYNSNDSYENNGDSRVVRQSQTYSAPFANNGYISTSGSQPLYTSYASNSVTPSASAISAQPPNPLSGILALLTPKSPNNVKSGGSGLLGGVTGVIGAASGGVKTALEIKRDIVIPIIMGIMDVLKNIATSETLQTIADVKLNAARTALTIGPTFIQALAGIASTAGEVTSSLISVILCNIICPLQGDVNTCRIQASCSNGISTSNTIKTTYSSSSGQPYIIS
ncbi:uncharacterized protein [Lepeophtheirus salmonis]|uniref:uncharacterized protein n=1 Tax=Lepeophtheirus salmonis TaxID=72036 RepID=UPI001AE9F088|nr:uncharacterized protein LOC121115623 [Lepeophtheirus salmonis]